MTIRFSRAASRLIGLVSGSGRGLVPGEAPRGLDPVVGVDQWLTVQDSQGVEAAGHASADLAALLGLGARAGDIAAAVVALATTVCHHGGGQVVLRGLRHPPGGRVGVAVVGLEVIALTDHADTAGTWRTDLVSRLASECESYHLSGRGATVAARFWPTVRVPAGLAASGITRPMPGERVCGDRFAVLPSPGGTAVLVVDGLGHGPSAAEAAEAAVEVFSAVSPTAEGAADMVERIHRALGHTRGAAVAVAVISPENATIQFSGLGNIAAAVVTTSRNASDVPGPGRMGMVSQPGVAGHQCTRVCEFTYPVVGEGIVILHSDGVTDRWDLAAYPDLVGCGPQVVAATLLRDAGVRRDDACVLAARVRTRVPGVAREDGG